MSGHCRAIKSLKKAIYRLYTLRPPDPDAKACEVRACAESKNFGGLKVKQQFDFYFSLSLTFETDDITSGRRDVDPHRRFRTAQGRMG